MGFGWQSTHSIWNGLLRSLIQITSGFEGKLGLLILQKMAILNGYFGLLFGSIVKWKVLSLM